MTKVGKRLVKAAEEARQLAGADIGRTHFMDDLEFDLQCMFSELRDMRKHKPSRDGEHLANLDLYVARMSDTMQRAVKIS